MENNEKMPNNQDNNNDNNNENGIKEPKKKLTPYGVIRIVLIVVLSIVCAYCVFALGRIMYEYIEARHVSGDVMEGFEEISRPDDETINKTPITVPESTKNESSDTEKEPEPTEPEYSEYFKQCLEEIHNMKAKYKDFKGFLVIDEIGLSYPIVHTDNNEFYLKHLINGNYNERGEIFMDSANNPDNIFSNKNIILYGHNLADGTKFNKLLKFKDETVFNNSIVKIITEEGIFSFKLFSFYKTDESNPYNRTKFYNNKDFLDFCENEQKASRHESNFEFTGDEIIITLSTCVSYFGGRWCTHGVLTDISH